MPLVIGGLIEVVTMLLGGFIAIRLINNDYEFLIGAYTPLGELKTYTFKKLKTLVQGLEALGIVVTANWIKLCGDVNVDFLNQKTPEPPISWADFKKADELNRKLVEATKKQSDRLSDINTKYGLNWTLEKINDIATQNVNDKYNISTQGIETSIQGVSSMLALNNESAIQIADNIKPIPGALNNLALISDNIEKLYTKENVITIGEGAVSLSPNINVQPPNINVNPTPINLSPTPIMFSPTVEVSPSTAIINNPVEVKPMAEINIDLNPLVDEFKALNIENALHNARLKTLENNSIKMIELNNALVDEQLQMLQKTDKNGKKKAVRDIEAHENLHDKSDSGNDYEDSNGNNNKRPNGLIPLLASMGIDEMFKEKSIKDKGDNDTDADERTQRTYKHDVAKTEDFKTPNIDTYSKDEIGEMKYYVDKHEAVLKQIESHIDYMFNVDAVGTGVTQE